MHSDEQALRELNLKIIEAENSGDGEWLASILAPRLAFQRADPLHTVEDQVTFLKQVRPGGDRVTSEIEPVEIYGDRAIVKCIVTTGGRRIHNLRLFVRRAGEWKLLAWANENV
jgi:hypothetical protein